MIADLLGLLAVGTLGFWIIIAAFSITVFFSCEKQAFGWTTVFVIALLLLYGSSILSVLTVKAGVICICGYMIIGAIWSIIRWSLYVRLKLQEAQRGEVITEVMLSVRRNKEAITGSIIYWPWSVVWFLINSSLKHIYHSLWGYYTSISEKGVSRLKEINAAKGAGSENQ